MKAKIIKVKQRPKSWTSPKKKTLKKKRSIEETGAKEDSGSGSSPSSEDEEMTMVAKPKHLLKPPKFDGVKPFETFGPKSRTVRNTTSGIRGRSWSTFEIR